MNRMSVEEILNGYDERTIIEAAKRIKTTKEIRNKLKDSRWVEHPIVFDGEDFLLPTFVDYRPLAVHLHGYGLWIQPIHFDSGKPDKDYSLHINESEDGLEIYVEDAFRISLSGDYNNGFILKTDLKEHAKIEDVHESE